MGQRDCSFVPLCKRARDVRSRRGPFVRGSAASGAALGSSPPAAPPRLLAASRLTSITAGSPARAARIRTLLRGITYLAGGALLAAVGVHAARHGGGNCSHNRAADGNGRRGVGRRRFGHVLDRAGNAALGAA